MTHVGLDGIELHLVDSVEEAYDLFRWLGTLKDGLLAFDTESTGLDIESDRVRLAQVSDDRVGWAIPIERWRGVVEDLVARWDGHYTMHNATFDIGMMRNEGVNMPTSRIHDTRLMGHALDPTGSTALKNQAVRYVDKRAAVLSHQLDEILSKHKWTWATVPIVPDGELAAYWRYGAIDPIITYQLHQRHYPLVQQQCPRAYELELAVAWVTERMERRGVKIDREYARQHSEAFLQYIQQVEDWTKSVYGVSPGSNGKIIEVLQREGFDFTKRTDSGALSLDKDVLSGIDHPLAQAVLKRRQVQKLESTYLRRFLEYSERDGMIHPSINTIGGMAKTVGESGGKRGVRTGRMSMNHPNFQQLPRQSEENDLAIIARNCVIPRRDDNLLVSCDFDQIEMRVFAHLAQDQGMIRAFGQDVDFFTHLARQIYKDETLVKKDPRRQITKNAGYAKAYGAGPPKFALTAGITNEQAYSFLGEFDTLYPGVKRHQKNVSDKAHQRLRDEGVAYVESPMTGRRFVADEGKIYALVNYQIQGFSAEILKQKLLECDAAGLDDYLMLPVHDEVILDVPKNELNEVVHTLNSVMNDNNLLSVPITAGVAVGERWGEKVDVA